MAVRCIPWLASLMVPSFGVAMKGFLPGVVGSRFDENRVSHLPMFAGSVANLCRRIVKVDPRRRELPAGVVQRERRAKGLDILFDHHHNPAHERLPPLNTRVLENNPVGRTPRVAGDARQQMPEKGIDGIPKSGVVVEVLDDHAVPGGPSRGRRARPASAASLAAVVTYGRLFMAERERRVRQRLSEGERTPRTMQAIRGHVTRELLHELRPIVNAMTGTTKRRTHR
jgi:hypothetical protein